MVFNLMNQTCKVCGEPAAGFHFGAFTCEGCKSFFGRSYNNVSSISECKNNGKCVIDKKNRTTCKACRLRKCYTVGMSKGGSRYGRRSNWFKIHCLLQEQQQQAVEAAGKAAAAAAAAHGSVSPGGQAGSMNFGDLAAAAAAAQQQQQQHSQHPQHHSQSASPSAMHHRQHLAAAQQMGGLLGYTGSPVMTAEMMQSALPFFSLMSGSPAAGVPSASGFPLPPPHLLFHPGYAAHPHHAAAAAAAAAHHHSAAAAAADAAYRAEMYKHRQSVDSAASAESLARSHGSSGQNTAATAATKHAAEEASDERSLSQHSISPVSVASSVPQHLAAALHPMQPAAFHHQHQHQIHSPIAIRATLNSSSTPPQVNSHNASPVFMSVTPEPAVSFAVKMQSLSPVSVCSISGETAPAAAAPLQQDSPIDLSMKASSRCSGSAASSGAESADEEPLTMNLQRQMSLRRKFYHLSSEHDSSDASCDAEADRKRQKTLGQSAAAALSSEDQASVPSSGAAAVSQGSPANGSSFSANGFGAPPTSLRGIFVCV